jgi:hypothetical protein
VKVATASTMTVGHQANECIARAPKPLESQGTLGVEQLLNQMASDSSCLGSAD